MPVCLETDFGTRDPYVGLMKAVLLEEPPYPPIVDLTHDVPPQNEVSASFLLEYCIPHLPRPCVVLVVVDPEVGTDRGILAVQTEHDRRVVAPDTGILEGLSWRRAVRVTNERFRRETSASTFHGRDWFAPVGRFLSLGGELEELGPRLGRSPRGSMVPEPVRREGALEGEIVHVDRFGNLITNLPPDPLPARTVRVTLGDRTVVGLHGTYDHPPELIAVVGSYRRVELAVPRGSARDRTGASIGDPVVARW